MNRHDDPRITLVQPRQFPDDDKALALRHTLNRHVPDMERGFVIQTNYGELRIEPGRLAERITDLLAQHTRLELMRMDAPADEEGTTS
jgi:hypothetical protein